MPSPTSIPRFLLPQGGKIWRPILPMPSPIGLTIRHASKASKTVTKTPKPAQKQPNKPFVLEKPAKFNPPSHGARLRKEAPRYPGPKLSEEEAARQKTKKYPNMMPAEGTFMHWFIHNRSIHLYITLGTLFGMAATVWVSNFKRTSPFAEMLPAWSQLFVHPIAFFRTFGEVIKMNSDYITAETMERRKRKVEDVAKRAAYRKAHGLDKNEGFGGWTAKTDDELLGPGIPVGGAEMVKEGEVEVQTDSVAAPVVREKRPLKKWFGIW